MNAPAQPNWLNKVPEVTLVFWIIKMMSTTVGETAADYLADGLNFGLLGTSVVMSVLLAVTLFFQFRAKQYVPWLYWLAVVFISILGTLITDILTDNLNVPLARSTSVFGAAMIVTFVVWYAQEKTLSIYAIDTLKRELFYWTAILFTFALGTAAGDWVAEGMGAGYLYAALLFGGLIAVTALAHYVLKFNAVACFWVAYVLTRPFGASLGDLLSQPITNGGVGFGTVNTSVFFLLIIIGLVAYLSVAQKKARLQPL